MEAHGRVLHARKGTTFPYVVHPVAVAEILAQYTCPEDVVVAGFLHDTVEDAGVEVAEIRARYGDRVAELLAAASEPDRALPWRERKEHTIAVLRAERDEDILALVAGDKLDNVRAIARSLAIDGAEKTWARFNADEKQQRWCYRGLAEAILDAASEGNARPETRRLARTLDYETRTCFPDPRPARMFMAGKPLGLPHDARAYLARPIDHWRPGYSAYELAHSWIGADGIPPEVRSVLDTCDVFAGCRLVEGLFEREVELGTPGRPSQTDVLVLVELAGGGYGVIATEGKAREPFGDLVDTWNTTDGKMHGWTTSADNSGSTSRKRRASATSSSIGPSRPYARRRGTARPRRSCWSTRWIPTTAGSATIRRSRRCWPYPSTSGPCPILSTETGSRYASAGCEPHRTSALPERLHTWRGWARKPSGRSCTRRSGGSRTTSAAPSTAGAGDDSYGIKKQTVLDRLAAFFDRYFALG